MTNKLPADSQMTDVFGRFQTTLPPAGEISGPTISNQKKAILSTAAVLLGGGAVFAAIHFDDIRDYAEGNDGFSTTDEVSSEAESSAASAAAATTVRHHAASAVQNGTITPNENIAIASRIEEQMPFKEAYAAAREETGPGGIFSWHGQVYNTYTVEEWQGLSLGQRQEFLSDVGYRPTQGTDVIENEPTTESEPITDTMNDEAAGDETPLIADTSVEANHQNEVIEAETSTETEDIEPNYIELIINGRPALGIDDDHDGVADAIIFVDEDTDILLAFMDVEGDNRIDTVIQFDATSQQVIGQQALEDPFVAEMSRLEDLSELDYEEPGDTIALVTDSEGTFDDDDNDYTDDEGYVNDAELPEMN